MRVSRSSSSGTWYVAVAGEAHVVEVVDAWRSPEAVDREVLHQVFTGVDAMDHALEVDRLGRILVGRAPPAVVPVGVVADDALLGVEPLPSVERQLVVALVALCQVHDG